MEDEDDVIDLMEEDEPVATGQLPQSVSLPAGNIKPGS